MARFDIPAELVPYDKWVKVVITCIDRKFTMTLDCKKVPKSKIPNFDITGALQITLDFPGYIDAFKVVQNPGKDLSLRFDTVDMTHPSAYAYAVDKQPLFVPTPDGNPNTDMEMFQKDFEVSYHCYKQFQYTTYLYIDGFKYGRRAPRVYYSLNECPNPKDILRKTGIKQRVDKKYRITFATEDDENMALMHYGV